MLIILKILLSPTILLLYREDINYWVIARVSTASVAGWLGRPLYHPLALYEDMKCSNFKRIHRILKDFLIVLRKVAENSNIQNSYSPSNTPKDNYLKSKQQQNKNKDKDNKNKNKLIISEVRSRFLVPINWLLDKDFSNSYNLNKNSNNNNNTGNKKVKLDQKKLNKHQP